MMQHSSMRWEVMLTQMSIYGVLIQDIIFRCINNLIGIDMLFTPLFRSFQNLPKSFKLYFAKLHYT
jgi:hypothetical protein